MMKIKKSLSTAVLIAIATGSTAYADLTDGLLSYWNFDNNLTDQSQGFAGTSGTVADDGTFVGTTAYATSKSGFGSALDLDGSSLVDIAHSSDISVTGTDFTISVWVQVAAFTTNWQTALGKGEGDNYRIARNRNRDNLAANVGGSDLQTTDSAPFSVNDGLWHNILAVSDVNDTGLSSYYLDGALIGTATIGAGLIDSGSSLFIGGNPESTVSSSDPTLEPREWNGLIDEVGIWDRVLTSTEIAEVFSASSSLIPEPSTYASIFGAVALLGVAMRRRRA